MRYPHKLGWYIFPILTSAEIHDFDFEIFNFGIEFGDLGFQVISFFIDLVAFCVNFAAQISQFIITWNANLRKT